MDERIIPTIVLLLNFVISIFGVFLTDFSLIFSVWSIISMLLIVIVAFMAYENAKKFNGINQESK